MPPASEADGTLIDPTARIHESAIVERGVRIGPRSAVWDSVHIRGPETGIGADCIIGEKTHISYGVSIADRVKINAFVYICTAVTIEIGVMISAGTVFTNDLYPRATTPDLLTVRASEPDESTRPTLVCEGATIGARAVIGSDLVVGRFSMIGMGSVVTRSVGDFHLVVGHPARSVGYLCRCGQPLVRFASGDLVEGQWQCSHCARRFHGERGLVAEIT